jgi:ribosomal protein S12 methylthiotransferase
MERIRHHSRSCDPHEHDRRFPGDVGGFRRSFASLAVARFDHPGFDSDEETSASYHLDGKVDRGTIYNRKRRLMALQRRVSRRKNRLRAGEEVTVLVEGLSRETDLLWEARMATQAPEIDGVVLINDFIGTEPKPGQMRRLRITEAHDYDLVGTLLEARESESHPPSRNPFPILASAPGQRAELQP